MTLYVVELQVPANTPDIDPIQKEIVLERGVITRIQVHFPPGCAGKVYTAAYEGHVQLFPRPAGSWLAGDGETVTAETFIPVLKDTVKLTIYAKSPGALYPHTITWRINVLPPHVAMWWMVLEKFINILSSIFGVRREWISP